MNRKRWEEEIGRELAQPDCGGDMYAIGLYGGEASQQTPLLPFLPEMERVEASTYRETTIPSFD